MIQKNNFALNHQMVAKLSAALVVTISAVVLFGWHTSNAALVQVLPQFAPMQYNTALGFMLSGMAVYAHASTFNKTAFVLAALVFLLSAASLAQYIFGIDLRIDQAIMKSDITVQTSHPGRMAPNTAVCFMLTGLVIGLRQLFESQRFGFAAERVLILLSASLAVVALLGYLLEVETAYGWASLTRMALLASVGFILVNIGLFATTLGKRKAVDELRASTGWLAFASIAITMMAAISLSFEFEKNEAKSIKAELSQEALFIKNTLESALGARFLDLSRMAQRWEFQHQSPEIEWTEDAPQFLDEHADLLAVGYVGERYRTQWLERLNDDAQSISIRELIRQKSDQLRRQMADQVGGDIREPVGLVSEQGYFVAFLPMYFDGRADGFVVGVFDLDVLAKTEFSKNRFDNYVISLQRDGRSVFQTANLERDAARHWQISEALEFYDVAWSVQLWPKADFLRQSRPPLGEISIGAGILLSGLFLLLYRHGEAKRRQVAERAHNAAFLETVLNNVQDGIVACDADGNLSLFNNAAREFHGVGAKPIPADGWASEYDLYDTDGETALTKERIPLVRALNGERVAKQEIVIAPKGLPRRTLIARGAPLFGAHGEKLGAVATMHDVTAERAHAEKARRREKELELIFNNVPVRMWLKDDKNNIVRLNEPAARSMGVTVAEAEGASTYDLFSEHAKKYHDDDLEVINSGESKLGIIEEYAPAAGERGWVSTDKVPYFDAKTGERLVFVASSDITKLVEAREELSRSNIELEQFARVASHDLQEPLRKLTIFSGFLAEDLGDDLPGKAKADLDAIISSAERMRNLVKDMLSLSRISPTGLSLQPVDPHECAIAAIGSLAQRCREQGAIVVYDDLPSVIAEPTLLTQVYQNLAGNALKFVEKARAPRLKFSAERLNGNIVLSVEDNGIGVDPEHARKIFEPLSRLHSRKEYEGTGIGLAICKKTIESFGGKIWVEPAAGGGSCFKFSLKSAASMVSAA